MVIMIIYNALNNVLSACRIPINLNVMLSVHSPAGTCTYIETLQAGKQGAYMLCDFLLYYH